MRESADEPATSMPLPSKSNNNCAPYAGQQVLYLGVSGVLHPSRSLYALVVGGCPWEHGHQPYEAVPWLAAALQHWPAVRIVLTSTKAWKPGLDETLRDLGPELSSLVIGSTFLDVTTRITRLRPSKAGLVLRPRFSEEDYWRMSKSAIVHEHLTWAQPSAWVALDDEDFLWDAVDRSHLVFTNGCVGLLDAQVQERFLEGCSKNFGPPSL